MYDRGMDEQLICEKTGHRSVAVRSYKRTSSNQMKEVCDVSYGNIPQNKEKVTKSEPCSTISKPDTECEGDVKTETKSAENTFTESNASIEVSK